jgi:hypothetical protein
MVTKKKDGKKHMKIIEALKKTKDLQRKSADILDKVKTHCADLDCENPIYPDQKKQVAEWMQSYSDLVKEIGHLRYLIAKTNISTNVTIELDNKHVTKTITEWISRRKDLAKLEETLWRHLTDRNLKEANFTVTPTTPTIVVKKRLYFDPAERDRKVESFRMEPSKIDGVLEITNAITSLVD